MQDVNRLKIVLVEQKKTSKSVEELFNKKFMESVSKIEK